MNLDSFIFDRTWLLGEFAKWAEQTDLAEIELSPGDWDEQFALWFQSRPESQP